MLPGNLVNSYLRSLALVLGLSTPCTASVKIAYSPLIPPARHAELKTRIEAVAGSYQRKQYGDLGGVDFLGSTDISISVLPLTRLVDDYYNPVTRSITTFDRRGPHFESILIHELAHAYSHIKGQSLKDTIFREGEATEKEYHYITKHPDRFPAWFREGFHSLAKRYGLDRTTESRSPSFSRNIQYLKWFCVKKARGPLLERLDREEMNNGGTP